MTDPRLPVTYKVWLTSEADNDDWDAGPKAPHWQDVYDFLKDNGIWFTEGADEYIPESYAYSFKSEADRSFFLLMFSEYFQTTEPEMHTWDNVRRL